MKYQRRLSNGCWIDVDEKDTNALLERTNTFINTHPNKTILLRGYDSVEAMLEAGKNVSCGTDWYDEIRMEKPEPEIDWKKVEADRKRREKTDYLANHDYDWYEDY